MPQAGNLFEDMEARIQAKLTSEYNLTEIIPIEEGGQSYSFKAFDPILQRHVFIKVCWYSEKYKDSLLAEPRSLSTLFNSNPNTRAHIANIYDATKISIDAEEYLFLKMEFCGDKNIGQIMADGNISVHEAINYAKQLCEGLHFLHSANILHRDIKPENLMIDQNICKLIDFGSTAGVSSIDNFIQGTSIKTKNYTPPEAFSVDKIYGKFSDIYQIGVVLHEMLNSRIVIDYSKLPKGFLSKYEKKSGKKLKDFSSFEKSDLDNFIIETFSKKNQFLSLFSQPKPYFTKKLSNTIKQITNSDYTKRPATCFELRNILSKLTFPNWLEINENSYLVSNWKGKDYKLYRSSKKDSWTIESSTHGTQNYRKKSTAFSLQDGITFINNQ